MIFISLVLKFDDAAFVLEDYSVRKKKQNEAKQRLTEFCQENALVIANTLFQHNRRLYTWT